MKPRSLGLELLSITVAKLLALDGLWLLDWKAASLSISEVPQLKRKGLHRRTLVRAAFNKRKFDLLWGFFGTG